MVIALLALGTGWDLWRASHPHATRAPFMPAAPPSAPESSAAFPRESHGSDAVARPASPSAPGRGKPLPARPIDLNRAGADEIHALPGIGPVLARRIVEYREAHGRFASAEELLAVRGIGPRLFQRIRPYVRV